MKHIKQLIEEDSLTQMYNGFHEAYYAITVVGSGWQKAGFAVGTTNKRSVWYIIFLTHSYEDFSYPWILEMLKTLRLENIEL